MCVCAFPPGYPPAGTPLDAPSRGRGTWYRNLGDVVSQSGGPGIVWSVKYVLGLRCVLHRVNEKP